MPSATRRGHRLGGVDRRGPFALDFFSLARTLPNFLWQLGIDIEGVHVKFEQFSVKFATFVTFGRVLAFFDEKKSRK